MNWTLPRLRRIRPLTPKQCRWPSSSTRFMKSYQSNILQRAGYALIATVFAVVLYLAFFTDAPRPELASLPITLAGIAFIGVSLVGFNTDNAKAKSRPPRI